MTKKSLPRPTALEQIHLNEANHFAKIQQQRLKVFKENVGQIEEDDKPSEQERMTVNAILNNSSTIAGNQNITVPGAVDRNSNEFRSFLEHANLISNQEGELTMDEILHRIPS